MIDKNCLSCHWQDDICDVTGKMHEMEIDEKYGFTFCKNCDLILDEWCATSYCMCDCHNKVEVEP